MPDAGSLALLVDDLLCLSTISGVAKDDIVMVLLCSLSKFNNFYNTLENSINHKYYGMNMVILYILRFHIEVSN